MPDNRLTVAAIASALGPLASRFDVDVLTECDSTNARLLARAGTGAPSGTVIVAERQTAGRGRLGRQWHSAPGDSLTFSLLWRFPVRTLPSGLSLAVGVAVAETLRTLGIEDVALKWPNDVLLAGRKLGGILVELASSAVVIGVGLNLRLPPDLPRDLLDVAAAIDRPLDCNDLLAKILLAIRGVLDAFAIGGFQMLKARWMALNAYADVSVQVLSEFAPPLIGRCCAVADDGALLIDTPVGVQRVISGDVSLRPA